MGLFGKNRTAAPAAAAAQVPPDTPTTAELMALELHYPANWAYEGEVEVLLSDGSSEASHGRLARRARDQCPRSER